MKLVITVEQFDCPPRLYKTDSFKKIPTIKQLRSIGADIWEPRKDKVAIDKVSNELYYAIPAQWIRPWIRPKSIDKSFKFANNIINKLIK